ncbi:MAG: hypothetical protein WCE54_21870 [Ignavibacteriaceae bacterium]
MKKCLIVLSVVFILLPLNAQIVFEPLDKDIYRYLERLSQKGIIEFNDLVKPLSRTYISRMLIDARSEIDKLTDLEKDELVFYEKEYFLELEYFNKENNDITSVSTESRISNRYRLFSYDDNTFKFGAGPAVGYEISFPGSNRNIHSWVGMYGYGYFLNSIGLSLNFKTNNEHGTSIDANKEFTPETGIISVKHDHGKDIDYSEVNSTVSYDWKWGSIAAAKDYIEYGYARSGNIVLSNKAPSFPFIRLQLNPIKWLNFYYFHAWLSSNVIDSLMFSEYRRDIYINKYLAWHAVTFTPFKGLDFSIGESVVYSDKIEPLYLMPLMVFYMADEFISNRHDQPGDANSQIFLSVSSRDFIKNTHLYGTLFIDELTLKGINGTLFVNSETLKNSLDDKRLRPQMACTIGASVADLPIDNLTVITEYTRINPYVYGHHDPAQTYATSSYLMGHWIGHNADLFYLNFNYRFIRGLQTDIWGEYIRKGSSDYSGQYHSPQPKFLFGLMNHYQYYGINLKYEFIYDLNFEMRYKYSKVSNEVSAGIFENKLINEFSFAAYYGL